MYYFGLTALGLSVKKARKKLSFFWNWTKCKYNFPHEDAIPTCLCCQDLFKSFEKDMKESLKMKWVQRPGTRNTSNKYEFFVPIENNNPCFLRYLRVQVTSGKNSKRFE